MPIINYRLPPSNSPDLVFVSGTLYADYVEVHMRSTATGANHVYLFERREFGAATWAVRCTPYEPPRSWLVRALSALGVNRDS